MEKLYSTPIKLPKYKLNTISKYFLKSKKYDVNIQEMLKLVQTFSKNEITSERL